MAGRLSNITEAKRRKHCWHSARPEDIPWQQQVTLLLAPRAGRSSKVVGSTQGPREIEAVCPLEEETTLNFI